jgi:predicted GTPase
LLGATRTQVKSVVPVISVCAVRTGCGKSPVSRLVAAKLRKNGWKPVVIRHPMPYGDLAAQAVQRFATRKDLDRNECTIEEREEYEPHIEQGTVVYAGVDHGEILRAAEKEADIILWDGGNNDTCFYAAELERCIGPRIGSMLGTREDFAGLVWATRPHPNPPRWSFSNCCGPMPVGCCAARFFPHLIS